MSTTSAAPVQLFMFGVIEDNELAVLLNPDSLDAHVMRENFQERLASRKYVVREALLFDPYRVAAVAALDRYGTGGTVSSHYVIVTVPLPDEIGHIE